MAKTPMNAILFASCLLLLDVLDAKDCGSPGVPVDGLVNGSAVWQLRQTSPGETITYSCQGEDWKLFEGARVCSPDGRWSVSRPWCARNIIRGKAVVTKVYSLHEFLPTVIQPPELTDGITSASSESHCLQVSAHERHVFTFDGLNGSVISALWIHTEEHFPMTGNDWEIHIPTNWSYQVTSKTKSPSVVIENGYLHAVQDLAVEIISKVDLSICEIELYAQSGKFECEQEVPANGFLSIEINEDVQVASYTCQSGYQIQGNAKRFCRGTKLTDIEPVCILKDESTVAKDIYGDFPTTESDEDLNKEKNMMAITFVVIVLVAAMILSLFTWIVCSKYGRALFKSRQRNRQDGPGYQSFPTPAA